MLAAFGDDDEDKPKRVLRTIQYTEEELRAMKVRYARTARLSSPCTVSPWCALRLQVALCVTWWSQNCALAMALGSHAYGNE